MWRGNSKTLHSCLLDLRKAHEQQKASLEEDFEKLRLSLQVIVEYIKV